MCLLHSFLRHSSAEVKRVFTKINKINLFAGVTIACSKKKLNHFRILRLKSYRYKIQNKYKLDWKC